MLAALILAVGLAMDATAVATARAVAGVPRRDLMLLAVSFGVFQAGMAAAGWLLGATAAHWMEQWDHWIAFGLLLLIGAKMLVEAFQDRDERAPVELRLRTILVLSVATSIDAFAAGVTIPTLSAPPVVTLVWIGSASFVLSALGGAIGARLGAHIGRRLEIVGGLSLIGIGVKTLVDHFT